MAANCRFAFAIHILAVIAVQQERGSAVPLTSERIARSVNTNPVVIRRLLAALREAGLVQTMKGAGGGTRLAAAPGDITLDAIYRAIECRSAFAAHPHGANPECRVGRQIKRVLQHVFSSAEQALETALAGQTLAGVLEDLRDDPDRAGRPSRPSALR